ncbi:MAG: HAD-IA family hydrolase [Azospirillaceae bacterium]|nr:HAD-IA family hydrolase [Azospirillaceae bacterium]
MPNAYADRAYAAFLFDMDGTLLNSIASANRVWTRWARRHGLNVDAVLATMHGVRAVDTIRRWVGPDVDVEAEAAALTQNEIDDVDGTVALPGAAAFIATLPANRWAVVTSAPRELAVVRLTAAGLPIPEVFITAEDVTRGKPAPEGYERAAAALGFRPQDCLVWEDAPAGIAAGEAAGGGVVVVSATHHHPLETTHPTVADYGRLAVTVDADGALRLQGLQGLR